MRKEQAACLSLSVGNEHFYGWSSPEKTLGVAFMLFLVISAMYAQTFSGVARLLANKSGPTMCSTLYTKDTPLVFKIIQVSSYLNYRKLHPY